MKKRLISSLIVFMLLINLIPVTVVTAAEPVVTLTVTPDKLQAKPGDEINYTIKCTATDSLWLIKAEIEIPAGLTYLSEAINPNIESIVLANPQDGGVAYIADKELMITSVMEEIPINGETTLATFKCKVDEKAPTGTYIVGLNGLEGMMGEEYSDMTPDNFAVISAVTQVACHTIYRNFIK